MYFITEKLCNTFTLLNKRLGDKEAAKIWVLAGSVLYWLPDQKRLLCVAIPRDANKTHVFYIDDKIPSHVVDIHVNGSRLYVVSQDAVVHVYDESRGTIPWSNLLTFNLRPSASVLLKSVAFDERSEYVCWCDSENESCTLSWRLLPSINKFSDEYNSFDSTRVLFFNAPLLSVKCLGNLVIVVPKKPVNILFVLSTTGVLRMFDVNGAVLWMSNGRFPVDFWGALKSTFGLWESSGDHVVCEHLCINRRTLGCLTKCGKVLLFTDNGYLCRSIGLHFPKELELGIPVGMCLYSKLVVVLFKDKYCIFCSTSGKLIQSTELGQFGSIRGMWVSFSVCTTFGFYVDDCIYRLRLVNLTDLMNLQNGTNGSFLLSDTVYKDSAFLASLQSAVRTKQMPLDGGLVRSVPPLQSHALLLALLQHCGCRDLEERKRIIKALSEFRTPGTKLDRQLNPLVENFLALEKCREQLVEAQWQN